MRGTRTVLASGLLTLALIIGWSARSAADECLAKPNGPTSQGQHWHYRIEHANNGRQCWYLRAESSRIKRTSRQMERDASGAVAQAIQAPAAPTPEQQNAIPVVAPIRWLNVTLPEPTPAVQSAAPQNPAPETQSDDAAAAAASGNPMAEKKSDPPIAAPNRPTPSVETSAHRAKEQQRRQQAQARPEPPAPVLAQVDHTFALLMIVFAALVIAGPALHFVERRRRREAVSLRPPAWARVVALNAATPRIRATPRQHVSKSTPPMPIRPPDQTERLAHALQQLVDRLQTADEREPKAIRVRPRGRV